MKCRVCRGPGVIDIRRHNANFCADHFLRYCRQQVERVIDEFSMAEPGERLLVAVSGGKDSLALWDILLELGYDADGLYVGLGIGDYSVESARQVRDFTDRFATPRNGSLIEVDLRDSYDIDVPTAAEVGRRVPCSACGLSKRHIFDRAAIDGGYDALVTGHNLDDEAAVLYGNVMRWQTDYLGRQRPHLPAENGFPRKIKPLVRLSEREMAAYCVLRGIDYQIDECPMAVGNKHLQYKAALNRSEDETPGMKQAFYFGFLREAVDRFAPEGQEGGGRAINTCERCGSPTNNDICSFCALVERTSGHDPVPVELMQRPPNRRHR